MRPFVEAGFGLLAAGYRGYSGNPGKPSEPGLTADPRPLLDWAAAEGYGRDPLVYYGQSPGHTVAATLADEPPTPALVPAAARPAERAHGNQGVAALTIPWD